MFLLSAGVTKILKIVTHPGRRFDSYRADMFTVYFILGIIVVLVWVYFYNLKKRLK